VAWWRGARGRNRRRVDRTSDAGLPGWRAHAVLRAAAGAALLGGLGVGGVYGWRAVARADALRIRELRFTGLAHASADELSALSPVKVGDHLFFADLGAVKPSLSRHPWVRSAEAHRSWPPAVVISVHERTAAALVDLGGLYLVDDDGNVFKRAVAGDGLDLPVITGVGRGEYVQRRAAVEPLLRSALALARAWREGGRDAAARPSSRASKRSSRGCAARGRRPRCCTWTTGSTRHG
jgi:cell division protein FtsQ